MKVRIKLSPNQIAQLLRCAGIGVEKLTKLAIELGDLVDPPLRPDLLLEEFTKLLGPEDAEFLLDQLLSLSVSIRASDSKSVDVTQAIQNAIENAADREKWDSIALCIQTLIDSAPIRLVTKAMELSYDHANLLRRGRILTDLRPIFDEEGSAVEAGVVTHTLRIAYVSDDGRHELSMALDLQDILKFKEQCERAIRKASTVRDMFTLSTKKPCLISGEAEETDV
ncbi:hypothetical protein [Aureliella helgolandensis]|uniref:Uncharacterized protein n=1 Tax=Aureliella helgolandensis TaxID=2527968 RepID=A0A518G863_9BACT|nr:hypothetical protein [Aureliella helgolandensis]QDV24772.1 hypothetical protein Q31a_30940 [Aureliella helgolandensis]